VSFIPGLGSTTNWRAQCDAERFRAEVAEAKVACLRDELRMAVAIIAAELPHAPMLASFRQALQETVNDRL